MLRPVPMVHECARQGCATLTMGELCLDHEREAEAEASLRRRAERMLPRLATASALVAAAAAGALIRSRLLR